MEELQYKQGDKLSRLHFADGSALRANEDIEIIVVMESGMHADIPHAAVLTNGKLAMKFCLHNIEGVAYLIAPEVAGDE